MSGRRSAPALLRRWWPLLAIGVSLTALAVMAHSSFLAVEEIEIVGDTRADVAGRVAEAGVGPGALLLYVDAGAIEQAVLADPWVADVRVERVFPDRVIVEVVEHDPLVWVEGVDRWMLVARDGTVLESAVEPTAGLMSAALAFPDLEPGVRPVDPAWDEVVELALVLADDIGGTLRLEMRGSELWTTAFGHEVRFGHPVDLADKGRTLRALLGEDLPDGSIIDITSPLRPAIVLDDIRAEVEGEGDGT